jgi:predicted DNA-binding transcriptional regulator AlpA
VVENLTEKTAAELVAMSVGALAELARRVDAGAVRSAVAASSPAATPVAETTMLTRKQVAGRLAISLATLDRRVDAGEFPKPRYFGERSPRWSEATVAQALGQKKGA